MWRDATIAATGISPRGRTSSSTGSSSPNCRMRWPISPRSASTPCRRRATTPATSPRINGPAWRRARSRIPASGRSCCGNTPRCIRNSPSCRASSNSRSPPPRMIAPRSRSTTSACGCTRTREARPASRCWSAAGSAARPSSARPSSRSSHGRDLLSYVEAILRVYNQYGRRDNIYKARIKILVHELGIEKFAAGGRGRVARRCATAR